VYALEKTTLTDASGKTSYDTSIVYSNTTTPVSPVTPVTPATNTTNNTTPVTPASTVNVTELTADLAKSIIAAAANDARFPKT
jgi:hypothetical protein